MPALILRLIPLVRQLAPLIRAAVPIISAIVAALVDYYAKTGGVATTGALGVMAGASFSGRRRFAAAVAELRPMAAMPAAPELLIEYRETGDPFPEAPYAVSAVTVGEARYSFANLEVVAWSTDQLADHPFEDPDDDDVDHEAGHPTGDYPAVPTA